MVMKMESKIDFKGRRYALTLNGTEDVVVTGDIYTNIFSSVLFGMQEFHLKSHTLHTNPDYKASRYEGEFLAQTNESKEMKSNKLADEIMEKGKEAVYTQEMFDNGILPEIGMKCLFNNEPVTCVGFKTNKTIIFEYEGGDINNMIEPHNNVEIKPFDNRSDGEKAFQDLLKLTFSGGDRILMGVGCERILAAIRNGDIHCVSFTGDKK